MKEIQRVRLVVFDLFGTLCRWTPRQVPSPAHVIWAKSSRRDDIQLSSLIEMIDGRDGTVFGVPGCAEDQFRKHQLDRWIAAMEMAGVVPSQRVVMLCDEVVARRKPELFTDAVRVLYWLKQQQIPWAVCSNASPDVAPKILSELPRDIHRPIAMVLSWQVGALKPHSWMYSDLGIREADRGEVVFVGDSWLPDIVGPLQFGFSAAHVERSPQQLPMAVGPEDYWARYLGRIRDLDLLPRLMAKATA